MALFIYLLGAVTFSFGVASATLALLNIIEKGGAKR